jgi:glycine hydroxymethyltransferase
VDVDELKQIDPEIYDLIKHEERYEFDSIRLIPSENYVSKAVLEATGSVLANKYSEGYPGRRYYEGQRYVDRIETVVVERAKALFHAEHANVQPYSGSPANLAVYYALAKPADKLMGLALPHGGHLSHGWGVTLSEACGPRCLTKSIAKAIGSTTTRSATGREASGRG